MFGDPGNNPMKWPEACLGDLIVGKPNNGIFKKNDEYGDGLPVVWVEELFRGNSIDCSESRTLTPTKQEIKQYGLLNGDVLFCRSSLKLAGIGYNNVYLGGDHKALFECHVIRISPDKKKIMPTFLNFALRIPSQRQKLFRFAKTVTMSTIDQNGLQKISIPVPPTNLQKLFSDRLENIDALKKKHEAMLSDIDALFASLQHRAFRGEL
jgi:type I restriction enzyme S subunit